MWLVRSRGFNVSDDCLATRFDVDMLDHHFLLVSTTVFVKCGDLFDELPLQLSGAF